MPKFSSLAADLQQVYCIPSVRQRIVNIVDDIRHGRLRVHRHSQEGVAHILQSPQCHFRTLFLTKPERCDHGEVHFLEPSYYSTRDQDQGPQAHDEVSNGIYGHVFTEFEDIADIDLDEADIPLTAPTVVGALIIHDEDEEQPRTLVFGSPSLSYRHVLMLLGNAVDDDDEDDE